MQSSDPSRFSRKLLMNMDTNTWVWEIAKGTRSVLSCSAGASTTLSGWLSRAIGYLESVTSQFSVNAFMVLSIAITVYMKMQVWKWLNKLKVILTSLALENDKKSRAEFKSRVKPAITIREMGLINFRTAWGFDPHSFSLLWRVYTLWKSKNSANLPLLTLPKSHSDAREFSATQWIKNELTSQGPILYK